MSQPLQWLPVAYGLKPQLLLSSGSGWSSHLHRSPFFSPVLCRRVPAGLCSLFPRLRDLSHFPASVPAAPPAGRGNQISAPRAPLQNSFLNTHSVLLVTSHPSRTLIALLMALMVASLLAPCLSSVPPFEALSTPRAVAPASLQGLSPMRGLLCHLAGSHMYFLNKRLTGHCILFSFQIRERTLSCHFHVVHTLSLFTSFHSFTSSPPTVTKAHSAPKILERILYSQARESEDCAKKSL